MAINFPSSPTLNQISQVGSNYYIWDGASWVGYSTSFSLSETVTFTTSAGIATYATNAGIATYSTSAGIATYATNAGIATYSTSAGIATYSTSAGIATNSQGLTGTPNINVGVVTASSVIVGSAVTINSSGINVTGIATIKNASGTVTIGIGTTALLVEGNARVTGILTVGSASITLDGTNNFINVGTGLTLSSGGINVTGIVTATSFSGSGTALTGIITSIAAGSNVTVSGSTGQVTINANVPAATNTTTYVNASGSSDFALSAGKLVYGAPGITERAVLSGSFYGYRETYVYPEGYVAIGATMAANYFGDKVEISKDGSTLVTASFTAQSYPSGFSTTYYSGLVYVYDCSGNTPTQVGILTGQLGRNYRDGPIYNIPLFGYSIGVSSTGNTIAVGAPWDEKHTDPGFVPNGSLDDAGIVYVYDKVGSTYNKIATIHPPTPSNLLKFGDGVCLSQNGNSLLVTPQFPYNNEVYLYDRVGNTFVGITTFTGSGASFSDRYYTGSNGLAMTANGQTFIVGCSSDEVGSNSSSNTGVVYVFDRSGNAVNQVGILTGSGANIPYEYGSTLISTSNHAFGNSVDVSDDGKTIVVGAPLDKNINTAVSGPDEGAGVVYVFDRTGNTFTEIAVLTGSLAVDSGGQSYGDKFGSSVAINADGTTIIVGAPRDEVGVTTSTGIGYVFTRSENTFTQSNIITGSYATNTYDQFGESVAISGDGSLMVFGASAGSFGSISYAGDELPNGLEGYTVGIAATNTGLVYVFANDFPTAIEVSSTGNIGIGTTNPTSALTVKGNTSLETLNVSGICTFAGITTVTGSTLFAKQLNVSGISTFKSIAISSTTSILNTDNKLIFGNDLEIFSYSSGGTVGNFINANENPLYIGVKVEEENLNSTIGLVNIYPSNDVYYGNNSYVTLGFGTGTSNNNAKLTTIGAGVTITGTTFTNQLNVSGIASVGTGITMYGSTGIISSTTFYGSGSGLTNIPAGQLTGTLPAIDGSALTNLPGFSITFTITAPGNSDYEFSGPGIIAGNTLDPVLYLYKGFTYNFVNTTGGSHPFAIRVSNGGSSYTSGVSGSTTGTQTFIVPMNAPSTLYYQCTIHVNMGNTINII